MQAKTARGISRWHETKIFSLPFFPIYGTLFNGIVDFTQLLTLAFTSGVKTEVEININIHIGRVQRLLCTLDGYTRECS